MLEFLISLLLLVLSQQPAIPDAVKERISQNLTKHLQNISNSPSENAKPQEIISENLSPTPEQEEDGQEAASHGNSSNPPSSQDNTNDLPDTQKNEAYNVKSERSIAEVANVAIQNSSALVACADNPESCEEATVTPSPTPTPSPSITPETELIILPTKVHPKPPEDCGCSDNPHAVCPMVYPCLVTQ